MNDCIFCKIVEKKIPAKIEFEDTQAIAIQDIHPQAPVHLLIIPKEHIAKVDDLKDSSLEIIGHLFKVARKLAFERKITEGYRLVVNNGAKAGQSVFHIHLHVLGGRTMNWPPG